MQIVFGQLIVLYIFFFVGWLLGKTKKGLGDNAGVISTLLVNVFLPCKLFKSFSTNVTLSFLKERYFFPLAALVLLAVLVGLGFLISRLLTKNEYERRVYTYSIPISNYAYLGYALIEAVFGESVLAEFMLFVIPFVIFTYTVGYLLLVGGKENPLKKLLNPIVIAIVLGVIAGLTEIPMPDLITTAVSSASACVGPLSMLITGITLSGFAFKELLTDVRAYIFSALRLIVLPAMAYLVCRLFKLDSIMPMVLIVTCMPCGLNPIVFPKLIGEDCKPGARLALITHVLSLITLPIWLSLIL